MTCLLACPMLVLCVASVSLGQDKGVPQPDPKVIVANLIKNLHDEGSRLEAIVGLADFGPAAAPAIPYLIEALKAKDEDLRLNAAITLGKIGKAAVPELAKLLPSPDEDVRFYAIWALGWIGPDAKETAPAVIKALADKNDGVRRKAAYALGQISANAPTAIASLIQAFQDDHEDVRQAAADAVAKYAAAAVPSLIGVLSGDKATARHQAAHALAEIGSDAKDAIPSLSKLLLHSADKNPEVYVNTLAKIGKAALPTLTEGLKSERQDIRQLAVDALHKIGADGAPALIDALGEKHADVRRQAAFHLGQMLITDKMVIIALGYALKDADEAVRVAAIQALQTLTWAVGPPPPTLKLAAPMLGAALADANHQVRQAAFNILRAVNIDAKPGLLSALKSKDENIRINTASLILQVNADKDLADTAQPILLDALTHQDLTLRMQAAYALALRRIEVNKSVPILVEGLKSNSPGIKQQAFQALQNLGQTARIAAPALVGLLDDADVNFRQQVIWSLQNLKADPDLVVPALAKQLKDTNAQIRYAALHALSQQGPKAIPALIEAITDKDRDLGQQAVWALRNVPGDVKTLLPQLTPLLKSADPGVRQGVMQLMARAGEAGIPHLLDGLKDLDANVRIIAANTLRNLGSKYHNTVQPALEEMVVKERDAHVRNQAMWALAGMGPGGGEALARFYQSLKGDDHRSAALNALVNSSYRAKLLPLLLEALKDPSPSIRLAAAQGMQNLGALAKEAVPALATALADSNAGVRLYAVRALGNTGAAGHPHLEAGLKNAKDPGLRQALLQAMSSGGFRSKTAVPLLIDHLKDASPTIRSLAAVLLGNMGADAREAAPVLKELLNDTNPNVRLNAQNALQKIGAT